MTRILRPLALAALLIPLPSAAAAHQDPDPASPPVSWRGRIEWIAAARWTRPADTRLNPGNVRFRIPQFWMQAEVRPHLRLDLGSTVTAVARPRGIVTVQSAWASGVPRGNDGDTSANWTELYVNWRPSDVVQVTYGLQNFQWGPAELLAPSNRIFHETGAFRDQLYYVRGRHLLRVNLSAGREWSVIGLAELGDNGENPFTAGEPFRRQGQVKAEYAAPSGRGYVGGTVGGRLGARPWFGEYGSWSMTDGLSVYFDATHRLGSRAWYPAAVAGGGATFVRRDLETHRWRTLAVTGIRYTFRGGQDARVEYVHQQAGYSRGDMDLAALAAASATTPSELAPWFSPGLEFAGRRLALVSLRLPDLPPERDVAIQGRYLRSLTDRSGVAFLTASLDAADALVLFASMSATHGSETAEFSRLARAGFVVGTVWTW